MTPRYPHITVQLTEENGNALAILARAVRAASEAGLTSKELDRFRREALQGDYNHLLQTCMAWFDVQ